MKLGEDLKILQDLHSECYSISELEETKKELNQIIIKYRELLAEKTSTVSLKYIRLLNTKCSFLDKNNS